MQVFLKDSVYKDFNYKNICLVDGNKTLSIYYAGTGDLHWTIYNSEGLNQDEHLHESFTITKENYQIYYLFEKLINDIKDINLYGRKEFEFPSYIETEEQKKDYLEEMEIDKDEYRKFNLSHYNDLYNDEDGSVTWTSDETGFCVANRVQIKKKDDEFLIEFSDQPYINGYEREYNTYYHMSIRFRNSGSYFDPFNMIFMNMFYDLQKVNDESYGHQICFEEYLHEQECAKKLSKKQNNV